MKLCDQNITKVKQIELQIFCQSFYKRVKMKKLSSKLKTAKFFIVCKIY